MRARRPHYFLRTQVAAPPAPPQWAFSLAAGDHAPAITAGDLEPHASWERLQLLAVVRGLEALPEPALVTLATASDVVRRGIRYGLDEWRAMDWQLEHFGELIPVKNADLWRRIDRALTIHDLQIRNLRVDEPLIAAQSEQPHFALVAGKSRNMKPALAGSVSTSRRSAVDCEEQSSGESWSVDSPLTCERGESTSLWDHIDEESGESESSPAVIFPQNVAHHIGNRHSKRQITIPNTKVKASTKSRFSIAINTPSYASILLRVRRRIRASCLHLVRRLGELWSSGVWFYEVSGLQQMTRPRKPTPPPWLRDAQHRENAHRS